MDRTIKLNRLDVEFIRRVEQASGQELSYCYQCGKCSAGCPIACAVEFPPHEIVRLAQLGLKKQVLSSPTIWLCVSCVTCTARCPKEVDLAGIMNALREIAVREGFVSREKIKLFEKIFLDSVREYGRLYEAGAMARYNMRTFQPFQDVELLFPLIKKGKLGFMPGKVKNIGEIRRIFEKLYSGGG